MRYNRLQVSRQASGWRRLFVAGAILLVPVAAAWTWTWIGPGKGWDIFEQVEYVLTLWSIGAAALEMGNETRCKGVRLLPSANENKMGKLQSRGREYSAEYKAFQKADGLAGVCRGARNAAPYRINS